MRERDLQALDKGLKESGVQFARERLLRDFTTFKIGGNALRYAEPSSIEELQAIVKISSENEMELSVLGKGSNLLINDSNVEKFVVNLFRLNKISIDGEFVYAQAGCSFPRLVIRTVEEGLAGLHTLVGIPASVGGAVFMNAGTRCSDMKNLLAEIHCVDKSGNMVVLESPFETFSYRKSGLDGMIIVACKLKLLRGDKKKIINEFRKYASEKKTTQPLSSHSAGCMYKNTDNGPAGRIIDQAGLKGFRIGNAHVSKKHANFIINDGDGSYSDVMHIIEYTRKFVHKRFGVSLDLEVKIW